MANALHENSPRRSARFLPINCAAIPAEILESELFGHEKGAFTGASARRIGKFELADKGTLFLDEIGELPLEMQVKLLRVLEQRELMRVGGSETIHIDIRLVAATNADLEAAVEQGKFRSDLYYRLKVVTLRIPPLRERRDDIPRLANHFLAQFARENERERMRLSAEAMRVLVDASWEGNVRELRNLIESLVVLTPHDEIAAEDLPDEYRSGRALVGSAPQLRPTSGSRPRHREPHHGGIERDAILATLERTGNRTQAAELQGIDAPSAQAESTSAGACCRTKDRNPDVWRPSPPFGVWDPWWDAVRIPRLFPGTRFAERVGRNVPAINGSYTILSWTTIRRSSPVRVGASSGPAIASGSLRTLQVLATERD